MKIGNIKSIITASVIAATSFGAAAQSAKEYGAAVGLSVIGAIVKQISSPNSDTPAQAQRGSPGWVPDGEDISIEAQNYRAEAARKKAEEESARRAEAAEQKMLEDQALEREQLASIDAIAARVRHGDVSAIKECQNIRSNMRSKCESATWESRKAALADGTIKPQNCIDWMTARKLDKPSNAMSVGLGSKGKGGAFIGTVQAIDDNVVTVYNPDDRQNGFVVVNKDTEVMNSDTVSVGSIIIGYGIQTGTRQIRLVSGAASTAATISAKCI